MQRQACTNMLEGIWTFLRTQRGYESTPQWISRCWSANNSHTLCPQQQHWCSTLARFWRLISWKVYHIDILHTITDINLVKFSILNLQRKIRFDNSIKPKKCSEIQTSKMCWKINKYVSFIVISWFVHSNLSEGQHGNITETSPKNLCRNLG